jgi:DNA-binding IclR family transcriptional regulator
MSSSAARALRILAAVGESGRPMGVTEIARALGVAPGTAFRGLDALQRAQLLTRHPGGARYVLGVAAFGLRQSLLAQFRIRDVSLPHLRQLASGSGETCSLYVRIGWYAVRIATAPGTAEVTSGAMPNGVQLLSSDFAGRAILAFLGRSWSARHRAWATARGIASPAALEHDLAAIRARGFAQSAAPEGGVSFPILVLDQAFGSVAIEGSGLAAAASQPGRHPEGAEIARAIEAVLRANPALAHQPFEHLDPDEITLPS